MNSFFNQLAHQFDKFSHSFISGDIEQDERQSKAAEGVVTLAFLAALAVPFFALLYFYLDFIGASAIVLLGGLAMASAPFILKFTGKLSVAREVFVVSLFLMKVWLAYYLGGIESPTLPWLLLCPMISMALGGVRQGSIWGTIITITVLVIFLLQTMEANFFPAPVIVDQRLLQMISMLGLFIFSAIVILLFRPTLAKTAN